MRIPHDRTNRPDGALTGHPAALCGLRLVPGYLDREAQESVLAAVREVIARAPLYTPRMPKSGKPMSVRMTNCGTLGWMTDERGYRYQPTHPENRRALAADPRLPVAGVDGVGGLCACAGSLPGERLWPGGPHGLAPGSRRGRLGGTGGVAVAGDACLFRIGGPQRQGPTRSFRLASGDGLVLGGQARLAFHGVDRILPGTSTLLAEGGRINLTLRRVTGAT